MTKKRPTRCLHGHVRAGRVEGPLARPVTVAAGSATEDTGSTVCRTADTLIPVNVADIGPDVPGPLGSL